MHNKNRRLALIMDAVRQVMHRQVCGEDNVLADSLSGLFSILGWGCYVMHNCSLMLSLVKVIRVD